jgi:hypothetical protein
MATAEGSEGNISAAEVQVDRAAAILAATRIQGQPSVPDFFDVGLRSLDRVLHTQPENQRLFEHVTLAKIELAQLRSAQPVETEGSGAGGATDGQLRGNADAAIVRVPVGPGATAPHAVTIPGHVCRGVSTHSGRPEHSQSRDGEGHVYRRDADAGERGNNFAAGDAAFRGRCSRGRAHVRGSVADPGRNSLEECNVRQYAFAL